MSESSTETSTTAEAPAAPADPLAEQPAPAGPEGSEEQDAGEGIDWKAKSREWEKRAKANASAAKKLEELEDAKKSEVQRATDKLQRAEADRDAATQKLLRYEVATKAGLPLSVAHRLQGSSLEELQADAKELAKLLADKQETQRKESLTDPTAGRDSSAGVTTAEQFAAVFDQR